MLKVVIGIIIILIMVCSAQGNYTVLPESSDNFNPIYRDGELIYKGTTPNSDGDIHRTYSLTGILGSYVKGPVIFNASSERPFTIYIKSVNTVNRTLNVPIPLYVSLNDSSFTPHEDFNNIKYGLYDDEKGIWSNNPIPTNPNNNRWNWVKYDHANEFVYSFTGSLNHLEPYEVSYEKIEFKIHPQTEISGNYKFGLDKPYQPFIRPVNSAWGEIFLY